MGSKVTDSAFDNILENLLLFDGHGRRMKACIIDVEISAIFCCTRQVGLSLNMVQTTGLGLGSPMDLQGVSLCDNIFGWVAR